jgi:hypothetical protein
MKKELLMASALVSTLGAASVAQAVTATMSGSLKIGAEFESADDVGTDTNSVMDQANFSVSLTETTDGGTTISSSFMLENESGGVDDDNAIKLTFSDGSALELLNAGNASGTHAVGVPGASGEQGVGGTTTNNAPTGISFAAGSTVLGVEWHSAADFMADGLKVSASYSADNGAAKTATAKLDNSWGVGATYVTDAGDTAVTIGAGISGGEIKRTGVQLTGDKEGFHAGLTAVTGNLTIGFGFADGDTFADDGAIGTVNASPANTQVDGSVVKAGISYVSGDITLAIGTVAGEAKDSTTIGTAGTTDDSHDATSASVTYAVASGVSAVLGYTTVDQNNEGTSTTDGGSAWYVGATLSF